MANDVIISYSSVDKPTADAVCSKLENQNIRCWIAPRDILPGQNWGEAIINAIETCKVMVLIFSSHSNNSNQVLREVERAIHSDKIVVPFRIEKIEPTKSMQYFLSVPHWLDAFTPPLEEHTQKLIQTIQTFLNAGIESSLNKVTVIDSKELLSSRKIMVSIVRGSGKAETIILEPKEGRNFLIGRDKSCHVKVKDKSVSMRHAMLIFAEKGWMLNDLGSTNGTFLNGKRVDTSFIELHSGDKLSVGLQELYVHKCISKR